MTTRRGAVEALGVAWRAAPAVLAGYLAATVLGGVVPVLVAWLTKLVLDRIGPAAAGELLVLAGALAVSGVLLVVVAQAAKYLQLELGRRIGLLTRDRLYTATGRLGGLARLEDPAFQDRLRMAQQHSRNGPSAVVDGVLGAAQSALTLLGFLATLATLNWLMAVVAVVAGGPALIVELRLSRRRAEVMQGITPAERREFFYADLLTSLEAAKEARLFGLGPLFRRRMLTELSAADAERRALDRREFAAQGMLGVLSAVVAGGGLVWAIFAARDGRLTIGDVVVFVAAVAGVQAALGMIVDKLATAHNALLLFGHYHAVTRAEPDLGESAQPVAVEPLERGIEFRDVWFRYSDSHPWVLQGVDLFIPFGQSVALVGHNGAGKSTLVKLLCRFYDPTRGAVLWDGVDLRDLSLAELRRRISAVFQDFMCYELSARENIELGDVDGADDLGDDRRDAVALAAKRAGIHDLLDGLPRGYRTLLSRIFIDEEDKANPETGVLLSGGQWQRVALARAFLRDARDLLILDEPASGLDAEAEHAIHTELTAHRAGRTSVLISHRLGSVRDADRIAVLVDGRVAELGTHHELIEAGGTYARLFQLQASGYESRAGAAK
ncbi:ATP-binding cassette subfamily B protein [Kibdelosporangium banguiense]|uniref:ATP-binding cassette subfamily B protein n=1 Tax=Kibdelosporangium banguiense TaxID=1365924 RepID=A0ABS4TT59_9PSEU|nr:ABC transporter ATP-binding protein [Kibdelosporangium banguiense]MBP2327580.1 ATP-binding cassette subfamily B protein [Kibdelosporangium banguiense]